jgi:predicted translin family RNA/ssDNA-binding protein
MAVVNAMQEECLRVSEKDLARESNTLIGDITQGGLNMIHIHSFNIYLKLSMIEQSLKDFGILAINL